ncbi:MAG TPA: tRNA pseudouridine(38-40) synthase TruA [Chthoniobacterales bacterium]|jgi:tRNA pseudouridine38-40 synthase
MPRQRLKLIISYDGAHFAGWQSQKHGNTVQDHLERAFRKITGQPMRIHGAGRTDSGVHALAQCAHADVDPNRLSPARWINALNASLPRQVRIMRCQIVNDDFHARFSAIGKVYRYRIWSGQIAPPLELGRVWHLPRALDLAVMKTAAGRLVGRHDFAGFAANRGRPENDTIRTIRDVSVRRRGDSWTLEFDGDGFLYKMVRLMVGALTECGFGRLKAEEFVSRIENGQGKGTRLTAPAEGLYLVRVRY